MKPGQHLYPMKGLEVWQNPKNGFLVFQLHYSSDPGKRDPNYIKHVRESMPVRQFKQEYELQWDSFEGLSVFADWDLEIHGIKGEIVPHIGMPLLLGFDFGLTPACIVCQLQEEQLFVLREFTALNMGAERFLHWMTPQLKTLYPQWLDFERDYICFIDPSGMFRKDTDETTCASIIMNHGLRKIIPGPVQWDERKRSVEDFLTRRTKKGALLQVSLPNCPILTRGFQGGYRYDDRVLESEPNKLRPKKDIHSHIHDALQMVCSRILSTRPSSIVSVPRMIYSWSQDDEPEDKRWQDQQI